jgi:hypothetical protein
MKFLKNISKHKGKLTEEQRDFLSEVCSRDLISTILIDGVVNVNVNGSIDMRDMNLTKIPIKFNKVNGFFDCSYNNLTSLKNSPNYIRYSFNCGSNNLTTLEYFPNVINRNDANIINVYNNPLTNYFKNIKEEDFKHWSKLYWYWIIKEYPFLINIAKNYVNNKEDFIGLLEDHPKTKLYLK